MLIAAMVVTSLCAAANSTGVEDGLAAFKQGRFAEALQDWKQAADAGDARGALYVGVLYDAGLGVRPDKQRTIEWYRRAADEGSATGAFNLGVLYDSGAGGVQDLGQAAAWYARAAASGFGRAEYNLALMYEGGTGISPNKQKAIALFQNAAAHGVSAARAHLARLGVAEGPSKPRSMAGAAPDPAMQDFERAQRVLLSRGPAEAAQAAALFKQAAERHNALAEYDLGYCYEHGLGVSRDPLQAYKWYRRSVADASDEAIRSIAQLGANSLETEVRQAQLAPGQAR